MYTQLFFTRFLLKDFEITRCTKKNNYSFIHDLFDFTVYFIHYVHVHMYIIYTVYQKSILLHKKVMKISTETQFTYKVQF